MKLKIKKKLQSNKGITLSILVITVIVLGILASVAVTVSMSGIDESKKYNFISQLELVEQKMLIINKEIELGTTAYDNVGTPYNNLDITLKEKVANILNQNGITDYSKYTYLSISDLEKIGLKNMEQNVIISYGNSEVYSCDGIKIGGNMYYSIDEVINI